MRLFPSIEFIATLAVQPSGSAVSRQLFEQVFTCSDGFYHYLWEVLLVVSYLVRLAFGLYGLLIEISDTVLLAWQENLSILLQVLVKVVLYHAPIPSPYG